MRIHKFQQGGLRILLDVESGSVHVIDKMIWDIMDIFDGENDEDVIKKLSDRYSAPDLSEALGELRQLISEKALFAPPLDVPPVFAADGVVKSMCLMVAHDCNLRCRYCFAGTGDFGSGRALMSREISEAAVEFLIKASGSRIHSEVDFFGGEPLVNFPVVKHTAEYIRRREKETGKVFKLTLTTNGLLLNDDAIHWLNENNISLVLSLDGREETHNRMRPDAAGRGTYRRVLENFRRAVSSRGGDNYFMRGTYTHENLDFTDDVLAMADEGFDMLSMEPVVLKDSPYAITDDDLPRVCSEYDRLVDAYLSRRHDGKGFFFFHFNMNLSGGPCVAKRLAGCGAGHEYLAVAADGTLYPCHQFVGREKYRLGSVFTGVKNRELPAYFRESHVLNKPLCRECWAKFFCSGGCHANADLFHGDIRKPYETGCAIMKKRLEAAIYVQTVLELEKQGTVK